MVRLKGLFKYIVFSSVTAAVVFSSAALNSFAYRIPSKSQYPDRKIDGHLFTPIILEPSDFQNMYNNGDFTLIATVSQQNTIFLTDLNSGVTSQYYPNATVPGNINAVLLSAQTPSVNQFMLEYAVINHGYNVNTSLSYQLDFPFDFYLLGGKLEYYEFTSVTNIVASSMSFVLNTPYDTSYQAVFSHSSQQSLEWNEFDIYLSNLVIAFDYYSDHPASLVGYEIAPNILHSASSLSISTSTTGSRFNTASPLGVVLGEWVVYVNDDGWEDPDMPTYADIVTNYLDEITNLSPENEERVNELKSELQNVDSVFNDIQLGLEIDIPDVNDLQDTIDSDVLDGSSQFSSNILSPILNTNILIALFGGLFAVVTMKLVLFGSGKS